MTYIKKLVMKGFKSFAKLTEIPFDRGLNIVVGPNGAGKSNICDALCFVLGRLSVKSMRAERASHLIYNGGKHGKPANEAFVELIFDNKNKIFSLDTNEISISRTVKKDGSSIYKINGETKTRQEVLELLAQAYIDPNGFNIILQGEIANFIAMKPEKRREIIEQISGINVYEIRKERALDELDKTEAKLKEINTILRERAVHLKNLEKERAQALKYNQLKETIKRGKATLLWKNLQEKKLNSEKINKKIKEKETSMKKIRLEIEELKNKIESMKEKIRNIDKIIEKTTGIEQEKLHEEIVKTKSEIAALNVKIENLNDQILNLNLREKQLKKTLKNTTEEISELESKQEEREDDKTKKYNVLELKSELEKNKNQLKNIEREREKILESKELLIRKEIEFKEREKQLLNLKKEEKELIEEIEKISQELDIKIKEKIKKDKQELKKILEKKEKERLEIEKKIMELMTKKELHKKDFLEIQKLDICPKCKRPLTSNYKRKICNEINSLIKTIESDLKKYEEGKENIKEFIKKITLKIQKIFDEERKLDLIHYKQEELKNKNIKLKRLKEKEKKILEELNVLEKEIDELKKITKNITTVENNYERYKKKIEEQEEKILKLKEEEIKPIYDIELEIDMKNKEIENIKTALVQIKKDREELKKKISQFKQELNIKNKNILIKEKQEKRIYNKFQKSLMKKSKIQELIKNLEVKINEKQSNYAVIESEFNNLKIDKAKLDAEAETLEFEFNKFKNIKLLNMGKKEIERKIRYSEEQLEKIGSVNLRALEVYREIKREYDIIKEKSRILEKEKEGILRIIEEVDKKKKKTFMKTFKAINENFSKNFMKLSTKGYAFLDLENKEDPFSGGVNISVKITKNRYLDINSLSGGEKVIITLALLFAIQDYKPYCFYFFDEIDAALDKRNSERLAELLKNSVKKAQYIIITHNDYLIPVSDVLYGISMQEGISKVISLKV